MTSGRICSVVAAILLCSAPGAGDFIGASQTRSSAALVVAELASLPFGEPMASWPGVGRTAEWQRYIGATGVRDPEMAWRPPGEWCAIARENLGAFVREAIFYPFRSELPLDCRLEQLRYVFSRRVDQDPYDELAAALQRQYGKPFWAEGMSADDERLRQGMLNDYPRRAGLAMEEWQEARHWMQGTTQLFLFRSEDTVQVLARTFVMLSVLAERRQDIYTRADWEVANAVRARFPMAAELILTNEGTSTNQTVAQQTGEVVLDAIARSLNADERAMLMLAASRVLERIRIDGETPLKGRPQIEALLARGVRFEESPYDQGIWHYDGALWNRVIEQYGASRWGELAFVDRLASGWAKDCGDDYRAVIEQGRRWLASHASSEFAPQVMDDIARAYETWWSLSQAPEYEDLVEAAEHREGADVARREAIVWYERLVRAAPGVPAARRARRVLIKLKIGIDTGGRAFYCRYP